MIESPPFVIFDCEMTKLERNDSHEVYVSCLEELRTRIKPITKDGARASGLWAGLRTAAQWTKLNKHLVPWAQKNCTN